MHFGVRELNVVDCVCGLVKSRLDSKIPIVTVMVLVMDCACKFPASFTKLLIGGMKGLIPVTVLLDTVSLVHIIYGIWLLQAPASALPLNF